MAHRKPSPGPGDHHHRHHHEHDHKHSHHRKSTGSSDDHDGVPPPASEAAAKQSPHPIGRHEAMKHVSYQHREPLEDAHPHPHGRDDEAVHHQHSPGHHGDHGGGAAHAGHHHHHHHQHGGHGHKHEHGHDADFWDRPEEWAARFDTPERDAYQRRDLVWKQMELDDDAVIADIGASIGYFSFYLAQQVPKGRVYAADSAGPKTKAFVEARAKKDGVKNLTAVLGEEEDPKLPSMVDAVFMSNTYHHIPNPIKYFSLVGTKYMKPGSVLAICEWAPGTTHKHAPKQHVMIDPKRVIADLEVAGFRFWKNPDLWEHHYVVYMQWVVPAPDNKAKT